MSAEPAPTAAPARRRGGWKRRLALALLSLCVLLVGAEIALRATGDRERSFEGSVNRTNRRWVELLKGGMYEELADPVRRYAMRAGADVVVDGWRFRANRWRARGEDFPLEKPPGEKRLLALGDSFCFGLWCDEDQTLVAQLARLANERETARGGAQHWRPINLGVPGYWTGQQRLALVQDGLALSPDVVVLYFNTNDIQREGFFFDGELRALRADHVPLPAALRRVLWHSHVYGCMTRLLNKHWSALPNASFNPDVPWAHTRADNQRVTRDELREIAALCKQRGIGLFFVNQPLMTWSGDARNPRWKGAELSRWAHDVRTELGVPGIDLLGWLRGWSDGVDRCTEHATSGAATAATQSTDVNTNASTTGPSSASAQPVSNGGVGDTAAERAMPAADFLPERYFADEEVQKYFAGDAATLPVEPDFHLLGAGYAEFARLCYPAMQSAGLLP